MPAADDEVCSLEEDCAGLVAREGGRREDSVGGHFACWFLCGGITLMCRGLSFEVRMKGDEGGYI